MARVNRAKVDNRAMTTMTRATVDSNNKEGMAASNKVDMVNSKADMMINNKVDMEDNKEVNKVDTMIRINRMRANNRVDMAAKTKAEPNTPIRATIKAPDMVRQPRNEV